MRKVLSWLLILLLPVAGLFGGMWLVPAAKPLWQREFEYWINVLGFVNGGKTLLVGEVSKSRQVFLIGFDPATGEEQFRQTLTGEHLQTRDIFIREAALSDDGRCVVIPAEQVKRVEDFQILLFDWKRNVVEKRFQLPTKNYIKQVVLKRGILTAISERDITQWKVEEPGSGVTLKTNIPNQRGNYVSDDSSMAIHASIRAGVGVLVFFDLVQQQQRSMQVSSMINLFLQYERDNIATIECVGGSKDEPPRLVIRHYLIDHDKEIKETGEDIPLGVMGMCRSSSDAVFVLDQVEMQFWYWKIRQFLSGIFKDQLPLFISNPNRLCVYDRSTMKLIDNITIPEEYQDFIRRTEQFQVNRHQPGIVIASEGRIDYWQLNSFTRYFPILGLFLGSMLSLLLIVCRYRRARKLSAAITVC